MGPNRVLSNCELPFWQPQLCFHFSHSLPRKPKGPHPPAEEVLSLVTKKVLNQMKYKRNLSLQELLNSSPSVNLGFEEHIIIINAPEQEVQFDEIIAKAAKPEQCDWDVLPTTSTTPENTHMKNRSAH